MLYHVDIGIPVSLQSTPKMGIVTLQYTRHALHAGAHLKLPGYLSTDTAKVIEIETGEHNQVIKIVYRIPYNSNLDLCLAIIPGIWRVKTVWINSKHDTHKTLDKTKYCDILK